MEALTCELESTAKSGSDNAADESQRCIKPPTTPSRQTKTTTKIPKKKQLVNRARNRLLSIYRDSQSIHSTLENVVHTLFPKSISWPIIANERCGTWYCPSTTKSCYFKSTDGHCDTWNFSFKRLNLHLLDLNDQGCILIDSSVRKVLPDSFARTIPIWACVLNRIVQRYRLDLGMAPLEDGWDTTLYTPSSIVTLEEHSRICSVLDEHVETLYQCKAIVNPLHLIQRLTKPIRPFWITNGGGEILEPGISEGDYFWIICLNPSTYDINNGKNRISWMSDDHGDEGFYYMSGAADDEESWARQLTPELFWQYHNELIDIHLSEDEVDERIDNFASRHNPGDIPKNTQEDTLDRIGQLTLWIGSRRAGRPPQCWENCDVILNVTDQEYEGMSNLKGDYYYLQLPVAEGKRDRYELERWMPIGLVYLVHHLQHQRRVLVHCNQGKDRSVAVVLAFVALACPLTFPLVLFPDFFSWNVNDLINIPDNDADREQHYYHASGLPRAMVDALLAESAGKEIFLEWVHCQKEAPMAEPLADKDRLRVALQLIRQDRQPAEPSRSTMQKINRFFMSSPIYRQQDL